MFKGKLKLLPDKARLAFPDRLGSLVKFDDREEESGGSDSVYEYEEELGIMQPNGFGLDKESGYVYECECEIDGDGVGIDEKIVMDKEDDVIRKRPKKDGSAQVSVLEVIAADEKRSDLEHELSQREINLEKLKKIASSGIPDGGGLRATAWKLLLGYLPPSHDLWGKELAENRQKYAKLKEELLLNPTALFG